jgi:MFS family permease
MVGPMLATWMVSLSGGVNVGGIRPLFFAGLIVTVGTFTVVLTQLSDRRWTAKGGNNPYLWKGITEVLRSGGSLKRWLVIATVSQFPLGMVFPFTQVFAHSIKGANELILGAMVTGSALTSIILAIPLGRLADRIGRKRVLYGTIPLFWLSSLLLIWAPSPAFLVIAGALQGFYFIGVTVVAAIERELVPSEYMGRWVGVNRFCKMVVGAGMALLAGLIWDRIGPMYVFIIYVGIDALIRMPLLIGMPETLHGRVAAKAE